MLCTEQLCAIRCAGVRKEKDAGAVWPLEFLCAGLPMSLGKGKLKFGEVRWWYRNGFDVDDLICSCWGLVGQFVEPLDGCGVRETLRCILARHVHVA